ncbi:hypothetical protein Leryth_014031 [Lithospermum erythrorhizon]|nr:hypothetical protein Leryth_014031 [Lithospermum erythrorhizon]
MAADHTTTTPSLSQQYLLPEKDGKADMAAKPVDETSANASASDEPAIQKSDEKPVLESSEVAPAAADGTGEVAEAPADEETSDAPADEASAKETSDAPANESSNEASATEESSEQETSGDQDATDETPEIKLETAPADFRFPTTNQTRHCFTRYIEYHRCIAAKGEGAPECDKFAKYYRALCPGEWVDRWNEQRENGTFPGPL